MLVELLMSERSLLTLGDPLITSDPISEYFGGFPAGNDGLRLGFDESVPTIRGLLGDCVVVVVVVVVDRLVVLGRFKSVTVVSSSVWLAPVDKTLS